MELPRNRPFRVSDAVAAGISRAAFDSRRYDMPFHGIRSPWGRDDLESRCAAYALKMRQDAAITSVTAAALWEIPLPAYVDQSRIHVSVPHGSPRPRARGVIGTERSPDSDIVMRGRVAVLSPAATWASLGPGLQLNDLIAAGDDIVGGRRGFALASIDDLRAAIRPRMKGSPQLIAALRRVRTGSRSRPESLARVLFTECGIPEPESNYAIPELGVVIDHAWPQARLGHEYQGGHHVDAVQHASDVRRQERIHDREWLLMETTKYDLFDTPLGTVRRLHSRLASRGVRVRLTDPPKWALPRR